MDNITNLTGQ